MERSMKARLLIFAGSALIALGMAGAQAGPCKTVGSAAKTQDAGSGPTPGYTGKADTSVSGSGNSATNEHPPTSTMNRQASSTAASGQDAQRQMQGQPTAAQQAESGKSGDNGC
jgi:hypothetical protein